MDAKAKVIKATTAAVKAVGSQKALAQTLNKSEATVSYWMKGEKCRLQDYFRIMEIVKKARTHAAIVPAVLIAVFALTFSKPSDANDSEMQTADKTYPAVYYVKSALVLLSRLLSGFAALPAMTPAS